MKKNINDLLTQLKSSSDGKLQGGFASIRGGTNTPGTNKKCTNDGISCSGTNSEVCTNKGDCSGTTNSTPSCTNSNTCFH